jgi:transposase
MSHARCAPACALFGLPDVHVLTIEHDPTMMTLKIETAPGPA